MAGMTRALALSALFALFLAAAHAAPQELSVLHIRVVLLDADGKVTPVPRHALLISDNPATAAPRRVLTGPDGTADVRLRPGNYTVESDEPVAFRGKAYQWTQTLDVVRGRDASLELTAANAEAVSAGAAGGDAPLEADPSFLLPKWEASVASIWTPVAHASGFLIDTPGLLVTSRRAVHNAASVEVQLTRAVKVAGTVVSSDPARDVAVIRIDPAAAAGIQPLPLGCSHDPKPRIAAGQKIVAIGAPALQPNDMISATVTRVDPHAIASSLRVPDGGEGGPVFAADGTVIGLSSPADDSDARRTDSRVVPIEDACEAVAAAEKKTARAAPPDGAHLPVEPSRAFPEIALKNDAQQRVLAVAAYQLTAADYDVTFITPPQLYTARSRVDEAIHRERSGGGARADSGTYGVPQPLLEFGNWSDYVSNVLPVVLVRATPRLVEGFWTKFGRGAALTQGVSIPALPHLSSSFSRMRVLCGDREVVPIHPFRIESRISDTEAIAEGLYVFDPDALAPSCASVKIVLYSQKQPDKADTRVVAPGLVQRIWDDFAGYRQ